MNAAGGRGFEDRAGGKVDDDTKMVNVPGLKAPTISIPSLLNSMPRLVLRAGGGFSSFLHAIVSNKPCDRDDHTEAKWIWPIPVPYPEAFRSGSSTGVLWKKKRLCLEVLLLDWFWLGKPTGSPANLRLGRQLTAKQWRVVRTLEHLAEDENSVEHVDAESMGRLAGKIELQDEELAAMHRALDSLNNYGCSMFPSSGASFDRVADAGFAEECSRGAFGTFTGEVKAVSHVAARAIDASRISFGEPPAFDPVPYLDRRTAMMYDEPQRFTDKAGVDPPMVSVRATQKQKIDLYRKMAACGRLTFFPANEVDPKFTSGLFSVPKDLSRDRLIIDSRPPNATETGLNHWTQCAANGFNVTQLELEPHQYLSLSGQEVKDFYYQFRVGPQRAKRNCLQGFLDLTELREIFGDRADLPKTGGYVALQTMAMGDICACEFAQGSHLGLLLQHHALHPEELLRYRHPPPRGLLSIGVVIDDLVLLEKVHFSLTEDTPTLADDRMKTILEAYDSAHLPTNPKKAFYNSATASFWGISVDGKKGLVRPNPQRLWPLLLITLRVVLMGVVTISLLESLAGSWVSIFVLRRRYLCVMNEVFKAIHCGATGGMVLRMSAGLKDELVSCCILGMMTVCNLRATTLPMIKATDASDWGMAAVSAKLPIAIAREASRFSLSKSVWSKLLPPGKAWLKTKQLLHAVQELPNEDEVFDVHPLWEVLARYPQYREEWRRPYVRSCHINIGELEAHLREEARLGSVSSSVRCLFGLDSQVGLGCLVKGRSSSAALNSLLSRSLPIYAGSDVYGHYGYFPSALNQADHPTRGSSPTAPDIDKPAWWDALACGDPSLFDRWLSDQSADGVGVVHDSEFAPLGYVRPPERAVGLTAAVDDEATRSNAAVDESSAATVDVSVAGEEELTFSDDPKRLSDDAIKLLEALPEEFIWWPKNSDKKFVKKGALDLYTGQGGVARKLLAMGCPFVVSLDWKRTSKADLLDPSLQKQLLELILAGAFELVGSAVICSSFSKAITPGVRSPRYPAGLPGMRRSMREKVRQGNVHARYNVEVIAASEDSNTYFWLENPDSRYLWIQGGYSRFRPPDSGEVMRADFCRFGTPWRKRTRVATSVPSLKGKRFLCRCPSGRHFPLRGQHPFLKRPWTAVAEPYPRGFAHLIARSAARDIGWGQMVQGCSRSSTLRVGEAQNPGPRIRRQPRHISLEQFSVQLPGTILLGERCWERFFTWCENFVQSCSLLELFLQVPLFLAHAIRRYGDEEFQRGGSLLYYRHLVLTGQRKVPGLKPLAHICWDLATRWELAEPVTHRTPIMPLPLLESMLMMAWQHKWYRWVGVTLLSFFGISRVGEVLRLRRRELLLPSDLLDDEHSAAYVVLWKSKTSTRQPARVQHLKLVDERAIRMLETIYRMQPKERFLYHGSPSMYRTRWDYLLKLLEIPAELRLTPSGLRGGGSIELYRRGESITNIQWRMRIRNVSTLESYIQEVAAVSLLPELGPTVAARIKCFSQLFRIHF